MEDKIERIKALSPIEAYNQAIHDCLNSCNVICVGDRMAMYYANVSAKDVEFFDVDREEILKNLIKLEQ